MPIGPSMRDTGGTRRATWLPAWLILVVSTLAMPVRASSGLPAGAIDLTGATVAHTFGDGERNAPTRLLVDALRERTHLPWTPRSGLAIDLKDTIVVGRTADFERLAVASFDGPTARAVVAARPAGPDGFTIVSDAERRVVVVAGADDRGALFGVGRLLRELRTGPDRVWLPGGFRVTSEPKTGLRGHQLGYRAKTNSYDAWGPKRWESYIRDLAVFGTNAVELVPPRTDDDPASPHFPLPPLEMMAEQSRICDELGLDVWVWFPVMEPIDADPAKVGPLLKEWDSVVRALPRLDAVFVPGGDPGRVPPGTLFAFLERAKAVIRASHPKAALWVSPQGFDAGRMEEFLRLVRSGPKWLDGVVFGPQVRVPLAELRKAVPERFPVRGYPDITHSRQCQHPVPDWDLAFAVTEGREAINPRPLAMARLVKAYAPHTVGFISYSEGCNDDVNKVVWSALGWDPDADVVDVLRQYGRYFVGDRMADPLAQALLGLERNWSGPLLTNGGVETTLAQLQALERSAAPAERLNWRFQQALYRGYYDAYVRDRLVQESALEVRALDLLRQARRLGPRLAAERALAVLDQALTEPVGPDRRARVFELGEALFQSIGMQLSKPRYQAIDPERGANLDTIDAPLNDRRVLRSLLDPADAGQPRSDEQYLALIDAFLSRGDPGPGGFHDDLGDPGNSPHLVREPSPLDDPFLTRAPFHGFLLTDERPTSERTYIQTFHDAPIRLRYQGLDPAASYVVRASYTGDSPKARMRLEADGLEVHPLIEKPAAGVTPWFAVPVPATADGRVELSWTVDPGRGGNGRGCQVAEVWLSRADQRETEAQGQ